MKINSVPIDDIHQYENNPRRISYEAINAVAASIKNFGFKVPIILDTNNEIVAGHTRVLAAHKLGLKEIPCVVADDLTPEQIKAFRLVDNKTAELSGWDFEKLDLELDELNLNFDMSEFGFEFETNAVDTENFFTEAENKRASENKDETHEITCPECGAKFNLNE